MLIASATDAARSAVKEIDHALKNKVQKQALDILAEAIYELNPLRCTLGRIARHAWCKAWMAWMHSLCDSIAQLTMITNMLCRYDIDFSLDIFSCCSVPLWAAESDKVFVADNCRSKRKAL